MGLQAIYSKERLSRPRSSHQVYPYFLADLEMPHADQVWCSDIIYIRLTKGFVCLVAVVDWANWYVLSWKLSLTLELYFCFEVFRLVLRHGKPEVFNSDPGSQFTSADFISLLLSNDIAISMDGRGIERLLRKLYYEGVCLNDYQDVWKVEKSICNYFIFDNREMLRSVLG